jgi:hypothetical protein
MLVKLYSGEKLMLSIDEFNRKNKPNYIIIIMAGEQQEWNMFCPCLLV